MIPATSARHDYSIRVATGTKLADLLDPAYWVNVSAPLSEGARIEAYSEDGELDVDLRVVSIRRPENSPVVIMVRPLRVYEASAAVETKGPYEPNWGGPHHKWRVLLGETIIEKGFGTRELAAEAAAALNARAKSAA